MEATLACDEGETITNKVSKCGERKRGREALVDIYPTSIPRRFEQEGKPWVQVIHASGCAPLGMLLPTIAAAVT